MAKDSAGRARTVKTEQEAQVSGEDGEAMIRAAERYNQRFLPGQQLVTGDADTRDAEYESLLNPAWNGAMGILRIPCIGVEEIIYHYADEDTLTKGIGHIHGSSLPVGGEGTHTVLAGHRGLDGQTFLTDMDEVKTGDRFTLETAGETLTYEVCAISTVLPDEAGSLRIEAGRDLATIVTCTPYGVNTHRLLVTGERVPDDAASAAGLSGAAPRPSTLAWDALYLSAALLAVMVATKLARDRKKNA